MRLDPITQVINHCLGECLECPRTFLNVIPGDDCHVLQHFRIDTGTCRAKFRLQPGTGCIDGFLGEDGVLGRPDPCLIPGKQFAFALLDRNLVLA